MAQSAVCGDKDSRFSFIFHKKFTQYSTLTGTAQKYENGVIAAGKYVSSFVGYFPANNPKYLALVIIDEPEGQYYGSTVAAPFAKEVFQGIIDLKNIKPFI